MNLPKGIIKTKKPKMVNHRGRTWDTGNLFLPNGELINCYLDTTWGEYFYFTIDFEQWYKGKLSEWDVFGMYVYIADLRKERQL